MTQDLQFRAGYVGLFGQTNVGKSTLLNAVLGEKVVITSAKPQTTRCSIRCVLTTAEAQIVFVDTPGLHRAKTLLGRQLLRESHRSARGLDLAVYVVEPWRRVENEDRQAIGGLAQEGFPLILAVNKIDLARGNDLEETLLAYAELGAFAELIPVSARTSKGLDDLVKTLTRYLPPSPVLFSPDVKCDRGEAFLIQELIREKVTELTYDEVPHSLAVRVKWVEERDDGLVEIKAEIIVDRESQKGIVIGKGGKLIKRIGTLARADIETFLGHRVFLELAVTVLPGWTKNEREVRQLTGAS
ncbi:MAG: GTPase Era [Thermotogota bacterium]